MLPAATWYEKHDISTTDMHPFVHSFNPAIAPPWEAKTDFEAFRLIGEAFSRLAADHLGTRTDVVAAPLMHDTPDEAGAARWQDTGLEERRLRTRPRGDHAEAGHRRA